jgi:long-chain fatty acid transport protein
MKQTGKIVRFLLTVTLIVCTGISLSANGLNLNGLGSKAIAMGGAFIGQADDYSAVFWNPAGLSQMKDTNVSLFVTDLIPSGTYVWEAASINAKTKSNMYFSGAIAYFKPINEKLLIGIAAYVPAGSGAEWDAKQLSALSYGITEGKAGNTLIYKSMIGVVSISPAVAYQATDWLSLGATLNANYAFMKIKKPAAFEVKAYNLKYAEQYEENTSAWGFGATFGLLAKPLDKLSIGLTVRTPVSITFKGDAKNDIASNPLIQLQAPGIPTESGIERKATWPLWVGLGISFKPIAKLILHFDAQYTQWSKIQTIKAKYDNLKWEAVFAADGALELKWKDTTQWRFGLEYALCSKMSLRAGYYYDPSPSPAETLNILLPEITYNVITIGLGYKTDKLNLGVCLEYLMGKDQKSTGKMTGTHGMSILVPNIAITYRF